MIILPKKHFINLYGQKQCRVCKQWKPLDDFATDVSYSDEHKNDCRRCYQNKNTIYKQTIGINNPYDKTVSCPQFLGIHIAENLIHNMFPNSKHMPFNNKYYDILCSNGLKIDVKSSCKVGELKRWYFRTNNNTVADYFACVAFDTRELLIPVHIWMIPNNKTKLCIAISDNTISKYKKYERNIDSVKSVMAQ